MLQDSIINPTATSNNSIIINKSTSTPTIINPNPSSTTTSTSTSTTSSPLSPSSTTSSQSSQSHSQSHSSGIKVGSSGGVEFDSSSNSIMSESNNIAADHSIPMTPSSASSSNHINKGTNESEGNKMDTTSSAIEEDSEEDSESNNINNGSIAGQEDTNSTSGQINMASLSVHDPSLHTSSSQTTNSNATTSSTTPIKKSTKIRRASTLSDASSIIQPDEDDLSHHHSHSHHHQFSHQQNQLQNELNQDSNTSSTLNSNSERDPSKPNKRKVARTDNFDLELQKEKERELLREKEKAKEMQVEKEEEKEKESILDSKMESSSSTSTALPLPVPSTTTQSEPHLESQSEPQQTQPRKSSIPFDTTLHPDPLPSTSSSSPSSNLNNSNSPQHEHVDIVSYPSGDLLRLLASLLEQIASANDALNLRVLAGTSHSSHGGNREGGSSRSRSRDVSTSGSVSGSRNMRDGSTTGGGEEEDWNKGRFDAAPLNSPVTPRFQNNTTGTSRRSSRKGTSRRNQNHSTGEGDEGSNSSMLGIEGEGFFVNRSQLIASGSVGGSRNSSRMGSGIGNRKRDGSADNQYEQGESIEENPSEQQESTQQDSNNNDEPYYSDSNSNSGSEREDETDQFQSELPVTPGIDLQREIGSKGGVKGFMPSLGGAHTPVPLARRRGSSFLTKHQRGGLAGSGGAGGEESSGMRRGNSSTSTSNTATNNVNSTTTNPNPSTSTSNPNSTSTTPPPPPPLATEPPLTSLLTASSLALASPSATLCFHARNIPAISIEAYLLRILKYCPTTNEVFLSLLVYFDRMARVGLEAQRIGLSSNNGNGSSNGNGIKSAGGGEGNGTPRLFAIDSFNVHRLVIAGVTVASKFFSDVFYTNSRYAKVGGLPLNELNQLELQFLLLNDFRLVIPLDELQRYADQLILFWIGRNGTSGSAASASQVAHPSGEFVPPPASNSNSTMATNLNSTSGNSNSNVTPSRSSNSPNTQASSSFPTTTTTSTPSNSNTTTLTNSTLASHSSTTPTSSTTTTSNHPYSTSTSNFKSTSSTSIERPNSLRSQHATNNSDYSSGSSVTSTITPGSSNTPAGTPRFSPQVVSAGADDFERDENRREDAMDED